VGFGPYADPDGKVTVTCPAWEELEEEPSFQPDVPLRSVEQ
jgi:hypothetical protein